MLLPQVIELVNNEKNIMLIKIYILSDSKRGLSVATPAQLYSSAVGAQPSVITRLPRPTHGPPFPQGTYRESFVKIIVLSGSSKARFHCIRDNFFSLAVPVIFLFSIIFDGQIIMSSIPGQPPPQSQRYFQQGHPLPPHTMSSHARPPYHSPNVVVSASHRPPPLVNQSAGSGHLPHPMYM